MPSPPMPCGTLYPVPVLRIILGVAIACTFATPAAAQLPRPLPVAAFDIRGFYSKLGQDPVTATDLGLKPEDLPARGLGGVAALTFYPVRGKSMALGIGGEGLLARGHGDLADDEDVSGGTSQGGTSILSDPIDQRLRGLAVAVSLNFGHRDGWSYVSAGLGPMTFATYRGGTAPPESPLVSNTLNFGGGARWFMKRHVAFCFDVRFYQTRPEIKTTYYPRRQRTKLLIMSAGMSLK